MPARKTVKTAKASKVTKRTGLWYINAAGKKVQDTTGRINPDKLYYLQPDGSYEKGGDARTLGRVKKPTKKVKNFLK